MAACPGAPRAAFAALAALLWLAAVPPSPAQVVDSTGGGVAALLAHAAGASTGAAPAGTRAFTLRRVPNPRWRPSSGTAPALSTAAVSRLRAINYAGAQFAHRERRGTASVGDWSVTAGEQFRSQDVLEFRFSGVNRPGGVDPVAARAERRSERWAASAGDLAAVPIGAARLSRLRGGLLRMRAVSGAEWQAVAGVPTPLPGGLTRRHAVAGVALERVALDGAVLSLNLTGFGRAASRPGARAVVAADSLAGRGGAAGLSVSSPLPIGALSMALDAQYHDLDGRGGLAARHALEWNLRKRSVVIALHDERSTRRSRVLGMDRFALAPRREDRWNAQLTLLKGRAEGHFTGVVREGGDPRLAARTVQLGLSGNLGFSGWYGGGDATWDRRETAAERRLVVHAGRVSEGGLALLVRAQHARAGPGQFTDLLAAETSLPLRPGLRLAWEPRATWNGGRFQQGGATGRITWLLGALPARLVGSLALVSDRAGDFRLRAREAGLSLSWTARLRARGELEVRRASEGGSAATEYSASYDTQAEMRESASARGWLAARDSGRLEVRVVRAGNGAGVADALVSLDGKELRFTDAGGTARFERVAPGVHLVTLEERSLPALHGAVGSTRVFVTVERGVAPDPVLFEVTRPVRRREF